MGSDVAQNPPQRSAVAAVHRVAAVCLLDVLTAGGLLCVCARVGGVKASGSPPQPTVCAAVAPPTNISRHCPGHSRTGCRLPQSQANPRGRRTHSVACAHWVIPIRRARGECAWLDCRQHVHPPDTQWQRIMVRGLVEGRKEDRPEPFRYLLYFTAAPDYDHETFFGRMPLVSSSFQNRKRRWGGGGELQNAISPVSAPGQGFRVSNSVFWFV